MFQTLQRLNFRLCPNCVQNETQLMVALKRQNNVLKKLYSSSTQNFAPKTIFKKDGGKLFKQEKLPYTAMTRRLISFDEGGFYVRIRGLPFTFSAEDVLKYLGDDVAVVGGEKGVYFTLSVRGSPNGQCFLQLPDSDTYEKVLAMPRKLVRGRNLIQVQGTTNVEMQRGIENSKQFQTNDPVVFVRNIPFNTSIEDIKHFFAGMKIKPDGILLVSDSQAYVQFESQEIADRALKKHQDKFRQKYIEIYRSSLKHMEDVAGNQMACSLYNDSDTLRSPDGSQSSKGHWVRMENLPYYVMDSHITKFFLPNFPSRIEFGYSSGGQMSRIADVEFKTHRQAVEALKRNNSFMFTHPIKLSLMDESSTDSENTVKNNGDKS